MHNRIEFDAKNEFKLNNLVALFCQNVVKNSQRPALVVDEKSYTYEQLFQQAISLAVVLATLPSQHCALLSARGIDSYIAILAILLAGKIYVPLSIKNPLERNVAIMHFTQTQIFIADSKCVEEAILLINQVQQALYVFNLPDSKNSYSLHQFMTVRQVIDPYWELFVLHKRWINKEAYLLFTSGSTGIPKAVMTHHLSIIEYINKMTDYYQPTIFDRFSQLTDLSFDVSIHELFLCWANGASLYVINDLQLSRLHRLMEQYQLTFWTSVPSTVSLLRQWNRLTNNIFPSIRHSIFLGEALREELAQYWQQIAPNSEIDNLYGPTEATIIFTAYRWRADRAHPSGYVPIGKPLAGQKIAILDENYHPVKNGEVGELYLSGSQVAKEYWCHPVLTAEKFIELNLTNQAPLIWYKTGDYVYWDDYYGLIYKGRDYDMFKVRGGRVERLEVEIILRDIAQTEIVAIVPLEIDGMILGTIAFIGFSPISDVDINNICRNKLPEYMVPTKITRIAILPLNKNGKVDYSFLSKLVNYET